MAPAAAHLLRVGCTFFDLPQASNYDFSAAARDPSEPRNRTAKEASTATVVRSLARLRWPRCCRQAPVRARPAVKLSTRVPLACLVGVRALIVPLASAGCAPGGISTPDRIYRKGAAESGTGRPARPSYGLSAVCSGFWVRLNAAASSEKKQPIEGYRAEIPWRKHHAFVRVAACAVPHTRSDVPISALPTEINKMINGQTAVPLCVCVCVWILF